MSSGHDRRRFFRELIRGAAQTAGEIGSTLRDNPFEEEPLSGSVFADAEEYRLETAAAAPSARLASPAELRGLCAELGLGERADEVAALAATSFRLTAGGSGSSRLGGSPELPAGLARPVADGAPLACVASLRLDDFPAPGLPRSGTLVVFAALPAADGGPCRVVHVDGPAERVEREDALPELPVLPSAELTLPALSGLDGVDDEAWEELRERLARLQGVELEALSAEYRSLHRLLGHPESLDAELELEAGAPEHRLLFQLSGDDRLGVSMGYERLTVWIRADDLRAGDFARVRAFVR